MLSEWLRKRGEERGIKIGEERGIKIGEERGIKIGEERGIKIGEERGEERAEQRGRLLERQEWEAWWERMNRAGADGIPFDEPPPSQRQSGAKANGNTS